MKLPRLSKRNLLTGGAALAVGGLVAAFAHPAVAATSIADQIHKDPANIGLDDLTAVIIYVIKLGLSLAASVGAIFIIVSGYQYVLAAGNPEKLEKAKLGLTWAIVGFILAISAYAIVYLLQQVLLSKQSVLDFKDLSTIGGPKTSGTVIEKMVDLLLKFAGTASILFLILGGYRYITSQGNQDLAEKAKKTVLYAVIGLIVSIAAYLIFLVAAQSTGAKP
jgi:hypothetical protein